MHRGFSGLRFLIKEEPKKAAEIKNKIEETVKFLRHIDGGKMNEGMSGDIFLYLIKKAICSAEAEDWPK